MNRTKLVLISGLTGFIGGALVRKVINQGGYRVRGLVRNKVKSDNWERLGVEIVEGDILNAESIKKALSGVSFVVHLAAALPNSRLSVGEINKINTEATVSLFKESQKNNVEQFIFFSTAFISWNKKNPRPNESSTPFPNTTYEKSKYRAEAGLKDLAKKGATQLTILRPGFVYGPGATGLLPFLRAIKNHRFFFIGSGKNRFELTYIDDLTDLVVTAIGNKKTYGEVFIISEKQPLTFYDFVAEISKSIGVNIPSRHFPKIIAQLLVAFFYPAEKMGFKLPLNKGSLKTFTQDRIFDTKKIDSFLGYEPKISLSGGVKKMVDFYEQNKLL